MTANLEIRTVVVEKTAEGQKAHAFRIEIPSGQTLEQLMTAVGIGTQTFLNGSPSFRLAWLGGPGWVDDLRSPVFASMAKHLLIAVQDDIADTRELNQWYLLASTCCKQANLGDVKEGTPNRNVFVIHGRDASSLAHLAAFIERLGYNLQILARLPLRGSETLIEALERLLPDVDLIVALFTPDDEGRLAGTSEPLAPRARENVLVESGFALIQRRTDSVIIKLGDTHVPSDLDGIRRIEAATWGFSVEQALADAIGART